MKKGFTLIELLAVIVILAIIALIAVPIVLNIIDDSKESSLLRSAEFYLDAVEYTIADAFLYHGGLSDGEYPITSSGDICKEDESPCTDANTLKVEVNGDKPTGGFIKISSGNISEIEILLSEKTIVKNFKGEVIYRTKLNDICKLESGTANTIGAKYSCDFGGGTRNFYILELGSNPVTGSALASDEVALILEGNYDETTQAWCASGSDNSCASDGLTSKLDEIAGVWTKLERSQIVLPSALQVATADGQVYTGYPTISSTNAWLYNWPDNPNYNGDQAPDSYWTSTPLAEDSSGAWYVLYDGLVSDGSVDGGPVAGVRPVVNLKI